MAKNRSRIVIRQRAARQIAEHGRAEAFKELVTSIDAGRSTKAEMRALIAGAVTGYLEAGGEVTGYGVGDVRAREDIGLMGKRKRAFDRRTYGDGRRIKQGISWDNYAV